MWYGTVVVPPEKRFHKVKQIENVALRTYVFSNYAKVLIKKQLLPASDLFSYMCLIGGASSIVCSLLYCKN